MGNETIGSILKSKGNGVYSVAPTATVFDAISMMAEKGVAAILVMKDGALLGIVSVKDYGRELVLRDRRSKEVLVVAQRLRYRYLEDQARYVCTLNVTPGDRRTTVRRQVERWLNQTLWRFQSRSHDPGESNSGRS